MAKRFRLLALLTAFCLLGTTVLLAQTSSTGRLLGTVTDQTGAVVAGANVMVRDDATGAVLNAKTSAEGQFAFANLKPGLYTVEVTMAGFKKAEFRSLKIIVDQIYDLSAKLEVGAVESTVVVEAGAEVLETAKPTVGASIVGKSITQLPFTSRDALDLAILMPGAATTGRPRQTSFMGLPKGAINITYDGINAQDNLLKSNDGYFTLIRPRVDSVDEFSLSTAAAGAEQAGEGAVQINFSTKRGGNDFHGGVWWYHRNDFLNSNYYFNNEVAPGQPATPRQRMRLNTFGYKIGGPVWKDKVFFFTDFDFWRKPDSTNRVRTLLTTEAASGVYRYTTVSSFTTTAASPLPTWMNCGGSFTPGYVGTVPSGTSCAATLIGAAGSLASVAGTTNVIDTLVGGWLTAINSAVGAPGTSLGTPPSPWQRTLSFNNAGKQKRYFPDVRLDWNISKNHQLTGIYHLGKFYSTPDTLNSMDPTFQVAPFNTNLASQNSIRHEMVGAWRWNIGSYKSNEVRFGVVTAPTWFFNDQQTTIYPQVTTNLGTIKVRPDNDSFVNSNLSNPFLTYGPQPRNTALGQFIDTFSWTHGTHNMTFGATATQLRGGITSLSALVASVSLRLNQNDPATTFFQSTSFPGSATTDTTNAQGLYALLAGRIAAYSGTVFLDDKTRQFVTGAPFREKYRQTEMGFYGTDNWRMRPSLTVNYGLRWEVQRSPYNTNNVYFEADQGIAAAYGVSGMGNLFKPGTLRGTIPSYHVKGDGKWYNTDLKDFAPSLGLAWQPGFDNKLWKTIFGESGKTVFRAGYSINFTREGTNNYLGVAETGYGNSGNQVANASTSAGAGTFVAGSLQLQNLTVTNVTQSPASFSTTFTPDPNLNPGTYVYDPNIRIPMVHSWSVGFQRELSANMVMEIRYVGNHGSGLWRFFNLNETNIFENGFLTEFGLAQKNLAICQAQATACRAAQGTAGVSASRQSSNSFGNWGITDPTLGTQSPLPIFTTAFTGVGTAAALATAMAVPGAGSCPGTPTSTLLNQCNTNFTTFTTQFGLASGNSTPVPGAIANSIAGSLAFMCNMAGTVAMASTACPTTAPATGLYPVNFFRVNPQSRAGSFLMANAAHSTYNGLTVEVRRRMARGIQFQANYTFSKSLTNFFGDSSLSNVSFSTLRDYGHDKGPSPWDLRHAFKFNGIWELPFGPGKKWTSSSAAFNRVIEGWEISGIHRWQSGRVFRVDGGITGSFNQNDGGVELLGITPNQIQQSLSIRKLPTGQVYWFPAALISSSGTANSTYLRACRTPGQFCQRLFFYGPNFFRVDLNIVKRTKITERVNVEFRAELLNAFNNINFYYPGSASTSPNNASLQSTSFGRSTAAYQDYSTTDDPGGRLVQLVLRINF